MPINMDVEYPKAIRKIRALERALLGYWHDHCDKTEAEHCGCTYCVQSQEALGFLPNQTMRYK